MIGLRKLEHRDSYLYINQDCCLIGIDWTPIYFHDCSGENNRLSALRLGGGNFLITNRMRFVRRTTGDRRAGHRKLDQRRDHPCAGGLRKRAWFFYPPVNRILNCSSIASAALIIGKTEQNERVRYT